MTKVKTSLHKHPNFNCVETHNDNLDNDKELINKFLLMLRSEKGLSKNTVEAYQTDLIHFAKSYSLISAVENDMRHYFNHLDLDHRSIARKISALRQFYHFAMRNKWMTKNPMDNIVSPRIKLPLPKILTKEEIDKMLEGALKKDFRLYTMLEILYATGLRISELISLRKTNFSYYEGHPILLVKGKGSKERIVPLNQKAHDALIKFIEGSKSLWIFPSFGKQGHITRQRMGQLLKELAIEVGIDPEKVSPHILRHAFATHMLHNGADLMMIKEILGHKNLSTSEIYLHVLPDDLKDLIEQFHPAKKMVL